MSCVEMSLAKAHVQAKGLDLIGRNGYKTGGDRSHLKAYHGVSSLRVHYSSHSDRLPWFPQYVLATGSEFLSSTQ